MGVWVGIAIFLVLNDGWYGDRSARETSCGQDVDRA
jgi:hypothetical protein